jgi:hypothetical protein
VVNPAFTMFRQVWDMAIAPASGMSPTQLAALEQIRALRAVKPPATVSAPVAPPVQARPTTQIATGTNFATMSAPPQGNRPRGSLLNITV